MSAYLVAVCQITNPNENFKIYAARSAALLVKHGGKYIVRGPAKQIFKGDLLKGQVVIISEFPSMAQLEAFVNDKEYVNDIAPLREGTGVYNFAAYDTPPAGA
jgi:uncharacterized protein (DUF1330 family)